MTFRSRTSLSTISVTGGVVPYQSSHDGPAALLAWGENYARWCFRTDRVGFVGVSVGNALVTHVTIVIIKLDNNLSN